MLTLCRAQEGLLQDGRQGLELHSLREICLDGLLLADADTLCALQIFQVLSRCSLDSRSTWHSLHRHAVVWQSSDAACCSPVQARVSQEERHPSAMGIGGAKEGFSVYGLLNRCVSPMGKRMLRLWFLRPIINLEV